MRLEDRGVFQKTIVKIRDFEKSGYEIGYEQSEGLSNATIKRIIK